MAIVLKVAAAALALIGLVTLYWGTNPALLSLGNTVMIVGAVIAAAGIVLFGLSAVFDQLRVVADRLDALRSGLAGSAPAREAFAEPAGVAEDPAPAQASVVAPQASVVALDRLEEALMVPPAPAPAPSPAAPTPPSRQSFGLPPLAAQAPFGAAAAAAGMAALGASAAVAPRSAEMTPVPAAPSDGPVEREPMEREPIQVEPVHVDPVAPPRAWPERRTADIVPAPRSHTGRDGLPLAEDLSDDGDADGTDKPPVHSGPDPDLAHAVEDMKAEVKAAEADLAPSPSGADAEPADPMASLERLLLGAAAADARAPAEPEPHAPILAGHRPEADEGAYPEDGIADDAPLASGDAERALAETAAEPATLPDPDDFMARLRETISRPVAVPDLEAALPPEPVREPSPEAPVALSIEEELERALKASLAAPSVEPPAPAAEPPRRSDPPRLELVRPEPVSVPVAASRDDGMAALARDFPELNDLLAPKKPAADPATSLIDDLKDIFDQPKAQPRQQEPAFAAPPAPAPLPQPPLLREGVIAGISFRLYGDGSIEADLAEGTTRFASLKDFRAHVGG